MAVYGPVGKENLDISFRLQSKSQLFNTGDNAFLDAKCDILASASYHGIVFVGSSNPELIVVSLKELETPHDFDQNIPVCRFGLPSPTTQIAANCDSSMLAVAVKINGVPILQVYSVASFLTPNIIKLREFPLPNNSNAAQLCWNPVINSMLAVCTEAGGFNIYTLNNTGIDVKSLEPSMKARCCCWSPKGKQIVVGFPNGKLIQFTPEMKAARSIEGPTGGGSFDTIAVQWLSTFQFAVAFLNHQAESRPVLHIVNAPKAGPPQFITYNDVCYTSTETRPSRIYIQHVMQWNLLLVASANAIDVSFLRITQTGDLPTWTQEFPNDLYPAELPLTSKKDESFPTGFAIDTGCSGRLLQEDGNPYPAMPMLEIFSTSGVLCSFYVLNTTPGYVDICSPPRPLDPASLVNFKVYPREQDIKTPPKSDMPFTSPMGQSTPSILKVPPSTPPGFFNVAARAPLSFAPQQAQPPLSFNQPPPPFNQTSQAPPPSFSQSSNLFQTIAKTTAPPATVTPAQALITVPPTFTPSVTTASQATSKPAVIEKVNTAEDELIYARMIQDEMKAFELELRTVLEKSRSLKVNIGTKDESTNMRRSIEELEELKKEAAETIDSLRSDVQSNRLGLTEMFSMVFEARAKFDHSKNEKSMFMHQSQIQYCASKRTLDRLVKQVSQCEMQLQTAIQVMNAQWSNYQEVFSKSKKTRMHNPSLEGLYQTLTKQQEIIYKQNEKMALLKSKLGLRQNLLNEKATNDNFSDSMISMSLADQVQNETSKLTSKKLKNLRNLLTGRDVTTITPQRPDRVGLNSEIIREKKLMAIKTIKKRQLQEGPVVQNQTMPPVNFPSLNSTASPQQTQASPAPSFNLNPAPSFNLSTSQQKPSFGLSSNQAQGQLTFGVVKKPDESAKPTLGGFGTSSPAPSFGLNLSGSGNTPSFGVIAKKDDTPRVFLNPTHKVGQEAHKPSTTIANANIAVSASFSIPFANKVSSSAAKEPQNVTDENKAPLASNENTSFTFKIAEKKDEPVMTIKAPPGAPNIASLLGDKSKGFSFGSSNAPGAFTVTPKTIEAAKPPLNVSTTTASIFSNFGVTPTTTTPNSAFGTSSSFSGFGSGFSLSGDTKPSTGFSLNLAPSSEAPKSASSFSFGSLPTTTPSEAKPASAPPTTKAPTSASAFNFGTAVTQPTTTKTPESASVASTFSFANLGGSIASAAAPVNLSKDESVVTTPTVTSTIASLLQSQPICSPEVKPATQAPPANIFASSTPSIQTENSSIFSSSAFGSALSGATQTSVFGSQATPTVATSPLAVTSPVATTVSIFSPTTSAPGSSMFGSLSLETSEASKTTAASPPTGLFSSLVKPDQSVFAQASTTSPPVSSPFGGIFSSSASQSSNVFGAASSPPTNAFGTSTTQAMTGSAFGSPQSTTTQANAFGGQQSSIFAQSTASGSLFSQSSFASPSSASSSIFGSVPPTQPSSSFGTASVFGSTQSTQPSSGSIFGGQSSFGQAQASTGNIFGAAAANATSPFGSSNVFGGQSTFSSSNTFGGVGQSGFGSTPATGSVFNQQAPAFGAAPTFGGQATFGSPKSNIFGQQAAGQSNTLFEQLGSQQSGNMFGSLAQNTPQPPQQAPQQAGFSGSAFSSWR